MDRRSPRAIQYSIKILLEYECWGLCGEVKKFMGAWKYDQTDIERLSLIIPLHEQRSGAVHGYPITTSDKRQTPAVTNCRSIFVYRKPPAIVGASEGWYCQYGFTYFHSKNLEQQCNGINAHSTTPRGYLFHCGGRYACLIRVISAEFLSRGHSTYRRASACYSNSSCTFTGSTGVPTFSSTPATMKQFSAKAIDNSLFLW